VLDGEEVMCEQCGGRPGDVYQDCGCGMNEWRVNKRYEPTCLFCDCKPGEELEDED